MQVLSASTEYLCIPYSKYLKLTITFYKFNLSAIKFITESCRV